MADNLEPRVSDLELRADSADNRIGNLEFKVDKLEGKIARISANKISKKQFSELGSKVALNQQKITKITNILKAKGTAKKEGTISSLAPETGKNTLIQINDSLISIKEQLELDYSSRINKEKRDLKDAQKAADLKKKQQKEKDVESLKKVGGAIGSIVGKIGAPIKNVFDKILDFFGALVGGFIINQALKPENIERIKAIFDGIAQNWKWVVGIAGGVLIAGVVRKLVTLFRAVRAIGRFVTGGRGGRGGGGGRAVRPGREIRNQQSTKGARKRFERRFGGDAAKNRFKGGVRNNNIVAKSVARVEDIASKAGSRVVSKLGLKGITKFLRPLLKRVPIFGGLIDFAVSLALGEPIGRAAAKSVGAMLGSALGSLVPIPFFGTVAGGIFGDIVGGKIYDFITGAKNEENNKESAEMNTGGKVAGNELGPNKDSVSAMLTPGEFVTSRDATNLWGISTLAAMNSTSGEMYNVIQKTFESQIKNNLEFEKANIEFAKVLSSLSEVMTNKKPPTMSSGGGGGGASAAKITPSSGGGGGGASKLKPPAKRKGSGVTMMPPQKQTTMTSLGGDQPKPAGDSIPVLGAEDPSNFFVGFMKEQLGIFGA